MLANATWSITNFALLIAEPPSGLPATVWIALSVACVVVVGIALRGEKPLQPARSAVQR
jgi:hypothetical protein